MSGNIRSDKLLLATFGLLLSFGSKHIREETEELFGDLFKNVFVRRFLIFVVAYVYSSDVYSSVLVTILFIMAMQLSKKIKNKPDFEN